MDAKDVIDMQVTVASLDVADELADALTTAGYVRRPITADVGKPDARSTVASSITPTMNRCGTSDFTVLPIPGGRPTCT